MSKNIVSGYHATSAENAKSIMSDGYFIESKKNNEWLGTGAYFFVYPYHARWWLSHDRFRGIETGILRATLEYTDEQMLDLDDPHQLDLLEAAVRVAVKTGNTSGAIVRANVDKENKPKQWCFACNLYKKLVPEIGIIKHTFTDPNGFVYKYSKFTRNQKQICVSKRTIVTEIVDYVDDEVSNNG